MAESYRGSCLLTFFLVLRESQWNTPLREKKQDIRETVQLLPNFKLPDKLLLLPQLWSFLKSASDYLSKFFPNSWFFSSINFRISAFSKSSSFKAFRNQLRFQQICFVLHFRNFCIFLRTKYNRIKTFCFLERVIEIYIIFKPIFSIKSCNLWF